MSATAGPAAGGATRLPVPKRDRRPALAALAVLLILAGALASALIAYRSGDRVDVLVARDDIQPGQRIDADDLTVARVANDGGAVVDASAKDSYIGSYATTRIPKDTLINRTMFKVNGIIPDGAQLVGVVLPATQRLSQDVSAGDVVRLYYVIGKGQPQSNADPGTAVVEAGRVTGTSNAGANSTESSITVLVRDDVAGLVAQYASAGQLAVAKLPDSTRPQVDLLTR